jgi:two-component system CheB/CheR fusion protein
MARHKEKEGRTGFPIVGMGASAGGLEAFEQFFKQVSPQSGIAFVLVPHLDPAHASMLTDILGRITSMPVLEAQDGVEVQPDHVYVIPPNRDMALFHGALQLSVPGAARGQRMAIDYFFRSLAEDQGELAICVILSGTGTDGTLGMRAVHGAGGISLVQDPATAKYDGMPNSAIASGLATYVLPVEQMPAQLMAYARSLAGATAQPVATPPIKPNSLPKIMQLLRAKTGHDFTFYKHSTIGRRIERRMTVLGISDMESYGRYMQEHGEEVKTLFKELLINVTSFFRDPEAFAALKNDVMPRLFAGKPENYVFRVWVAGCATGEEAYSLAILFREHMDEIKQDFKAQIYATDIDEDSIATARGGVYPANIAMDVSIDRLRRFFVKEDAGYRVKKDIREMVIFATQNVVKDPPFTKLDMVSCRNLLIYLEPELQSRLIPALHYALKPGGFLFLSPSESVGNYAELFTQLDKKWRTFQARASVSSAHSLLAGGLGWTGDGPGRQSVELAAKSREANVAELTRKYLLQTYAPSSVLTDEAGTILYIYGDTGKFLRPAPGQASLSVIEMAREGLTLDLRTAIHQAAIQRTIIRGKAPDVKINGGSQDVEFSVHPVTEPDFGASQLLLISFQAVAEKVGKATSVRRPARSAATRRVDELQQELAYTKESLQATIEELQASNEELKSTNEELQSTNEELQSTNEEIETSKEELQSVNEELVTVNAELQSKIEQLASVQSDMKNLLDTISVGAIFLDERLKIKRFTREAASIFRLVDSDVGRPLADIRSHVMGEDLLEDARTVLETLIPREKQVRTSDGFWRLARIVPYRTMDNVIEGVVLTFTDITAFKSNLAPEASAAPAQGGASGESS